MYKDFVHCFYPKKVRTSSGEWITVSCGTCQACLHRMALKASYQCSLHEQDYKYCMFVTLTYSNENIPLARLEDTEDYGNGLHNYKMFDVTERLQAHYNFIGNYVADADVSPSYVSQIIRKFEYFQGADVPYLCKYDAQCFLKRFRKHLSKFTNEKVTYYLVGEYGPVHFRPHFHVLFFFDSDDVLSVFGQVLRSSWSLGRVDFSRSRGKCSSYVAKYVNSRNSVPRLYKDRSVRPFCLHSQKFAQRFYQNQKTEIYENENFRFDDIERQIGSSISVTISWRSLVAAFFPKCRGFNFLSSTELTYSYTILRHARRFYGSDKKISEIVDFLCRDLYSASFDDKAFSFTRLTGSKEYLLYFINRCVTRCDDVFYLSYGERHWRYCDLPYSLWQSVKQSIASMLYLSNHFLEFVCDGDVSLVPLRLRQICSFYSNRDYDNLCSQYELQETLLSDCSDEDTSLLYYLYDNVFVKEDDANIKYFVLNDYEVRLFRYLSELPYFQYFLQVSSIRYNDSVKHKELNDLNNIFC